MKIKVYGAGKEVGRSCIEVEMNSKRFLFDAGLKITPEMPEFPLPIEDIPKIQALFLSHIHLDHTGAIPRLYSKGLRCPIYASPLTKLILPTLLNDSWKIARITQANVGYEKSDVVNSIELCKPFPEVNSKSSFSLGNSKVNTFDAGHIPGARAIRVEVDGESVVYTGDVNLTSTLITNPFDKDIPETDALIMESTYGGRDHPDRHSVEKEFFEKIDETLAKKGVVLVPTFSIGRAQELIIMLTEKYDVPIYLDGMAKKITDHYLKREDFVKNEERLRSAFNKVRAIHHPTERDGALKGGHIIVTTSGMLDGGPVLHYLPKIAEDVNSSVLMTGYQAEETNGRKLLNEGYISADGKDIDVKCFVKNHDFSAHASSEQLVQIAKAVNPKLVVLVHGDDEQQMALRKELENEGFVVTIPENGGEVNFGRNQ